MSTIMKIIQVPNSVFISSIFLLETGNVELRLHLVSEYQNKIESKNQISNDALKRRHK